MLPKFIGEKIIIKKVREYLNRVIDIQTAKVGCDFEERLNKSKLDFRWEMFQRIDATIEGIAKAIEQGMSMKDKGEQAFEERKKVLIATEKKMSDIIAKLIQIQQAISA
jgi:FKBP-type peptidyl-prolyl cis-trans isomerase 2